MTDVGHTETAAPSTSRRPLKNRRDGTTVTFRHDHGQSTATYIVTWSEFPDSQPAEIFLNTSGKLGNGADIAVSDAAIMASIALQYGAPAEVLRQACKRDSKGAPMGVVGHALDIACGVKPIE
jgi:hypothetical protein